MIDMISRGFLCACFFFFFKQRTAYEMRISDWSSDVCSSDLRRRRRPPGGPGAAGSQRPVHHAALHSRQRQPSAGGGGSHPPTRQGQPVTELASADIDRLWSQYKDSGSRRARDQLIVHYSPLVKYVAGRVAVGLPQNVDQADLVSYGLFGLIDAIDKFEPERGFKFETSAISRIKGNILHQLRALDWVPRSGRPMARPIPARRCA